MDDLFFFSLIVLSIYTIIPTILIRVFGLGAYKEASGQQGVALTFDDGPDPQYTPQLLDLLQQYNVKATFFVLGSKAEKHPELIRRMHQEGHLVGVHNYVHHTNGLMSPWKVRGQLRDSIRTIERIIGVKPIHYRPPWGVFNLFDFFLFRKFRVVLWSLIVGDWVSRGGSERIKQQLLKKLKNGDVIVLHDSGQTFGADRDAPAHMLQALREFLEEASKQGYAFKRIDEHLAEPA
ncbi:polysaccharide deacetylase family protein [Paenibacillus chartarius]|uniref:Polysaccharide deacetylase family protein n=1 Tax=Paenibacillus chartarius TaxID=747481 RepID=A0ABV6DR72_9BACL